MSRFPMITMVLFCTVVLNGFVLCVPIDALLLSVSATTAAATRSSEAVASGTATATATAIAVEASSFASAKLQLNLQSQLGSGAAAAAARSEVFVKGKAKRMSLNYRYNIALKGESLTGDRHAVYESLKSYARRDLPKKLLKRVDSPGEIAYYTIGGLLSLSLTVLCFYGCLRLCCSRQKSPQEHLDRILRDSGQVSERARLRANMFEHRQARPHAGDRSGEPSFEQRQQQRRTRQASHETSASPSTSSNQQSRLHASPLSPPPPTYETISNEDLPLHPMTRESLARRFPMQNYSAQRAANPNDSPGNRPLPFTGNSNRSNDIPDLRPRPPDYRTSCTEPSLAHSLFSQLGLQSRMSTNSQSSGRRLSFSAPGSDDQDNAREGRIAAASQSPTLFHLPSPPRTYPPPYSCNPEPS